MAKIWTSELFSFRKRGLMEGDDESSGVPVCVVGAGAACLVKYGIGVRKCP